MGNTELVFDKREQILFVHFIKPVHLETDRDVDLHFAETRTFWESTVKARVYVVVDMAGLEIDPSQVDAYARNVKYFLDHIAITVVRHGGTSLQRTSSRLASMKLHVPSRIYGSRQEAIEVIRGLRAGTITLGSES